MLHPRAQDKLEFKELALEIEADNKRRTLIACGTAAVGALVVARYSDEFQWAQKTFRGLYIEPKAEVRPPASRRRAPFGCPPRRAVRLPSEAPPVASQRCLPERRPRNDVPFSTTSSCTAPHCAAPYPSLPRARALPADPHRPALTWQLTPIARP